jgi:drug/metabolite transporter (DMT)-like permease
VEALTADPKSAEPASSLLRRAVLFGLAGEGVLTLMDTLIKTLTPRYPTFEITFLRFACGSVFAVALFAATRPGWPSRDALRYHGLRAVLVVITASCFFYGLSKVPIAEAMALSFLSPLFMALFGVVLLKERFDSRIAMALAAGLVGMAVIVSGQYGGGSYSLDTVKGAAAITMAAFCYSLVVVLLRARASIDPIPVIILLQNLLPAVILAPAAAYVWTPIAGEDLAWFFVIGFLGVFGHWLITNAFARAEAARLAPIHYSILVWGILFGILFFGEYPGLYTLLGASLIVIASFITQKR